MSKKIRILITVSIVLNVIFLGFAVGAVYRHMDNKPWRELRSELAPETKHLMARQFEKNHTELETVVKRAKSQKEKLIEMLTAENFDRARFEREAKRLHGYQSQIRERKLESLAELADQLPMTERDKLCGLFRHALHEKPRHGGKPKHPIAKKPVPIPERRPEE